MHREIVALRGSALLGLLRHAFEPSPPTLLVKKGADSFSLFEMDFEKLTIRRLIYWELTYKIF